MPDMKSLTLGRRIAALRRAREWTQEDLAEQMNVSPQAVSKWERDLSCPDVGSLPRLAEALRVTIDMLLTGADAAIPAQPPRKPEELIVRLAIEPDDGARIGLNLPFTVFRLMAVHGMLSITYTTDGGEVNAAALAQLKHLDFPTIARMIESGVTGQLLDITDDGFRMTVWTE